MTRRTLFASLVGAPVAAGWTYFAPKPKVDPAKLEALVVATADMLAACPRIDTYWESERHPLIKFERGETVFHFEFSNEDMARMATQRYRQDECAK